jgi:outer membrane protein, heavy metal efflux system
MKPLILSKLSRLSAGLIVVLSLTTEIVRAQEGSAQSSAPAVESTIDALVMEALEKNPELRFYDAEIAVARAGRKTSALIGNPELSATIGQKTVRAGGLNVEGVAWSVSVLQPFEWPGRLGLRKAIANHDLKLAELGRAQFRLALAGRVRLLAYGWLAAQEKAVAADEVAARFKALREVLVQRDPAGLTPLLEMRVIEATELNAQRAASEALLLAQAARLKLNQLRGAAPDGPLALPSTQLAFRSAEKAETLLALARTNNFEVRLRSVELAQQGVRVELAKNERYPAISVGPMISEERAGDRERIIGAGISLPLPLWNRNQGAIEAAAARQLQAQTSLHVFWREIERQVIEAALTYETKLREMSDWRPGSVGHFREAAEVADRHYRLGAVPVSTYVELQKQYLQAVQSLLDTRKETLEAATQLQLLTGMELSLVSTDPLEGGRK